MNIENIQAYLKTFDFINFALLFGSSVNKQIHFFSDIDIAIHTKRELELLEIGELVINLEDILHKKVDLVILNGLYKKNSFLSYNITTNNEVIILNDENLYIDFKTNSFLWYFDFEPTLKMFNENFLKRVENGNFGKTKTA
ncbi:MAG: nucleotidyltransferase domain-containing protein [Campylobacterales bacterium]|nr:nucleotidyltransferase domain-containing protein [Campylobacterales bacterium]